MKIGIMTFHWAANYGAVLQAYALLEHLNNTGHEAQDINYLPRRAMLTNLFFDIYLRRFINIRRAAKFKRFRKRFLRISANTYSSYKELKRVGHTYDAVIAGSDQIWNESFLMTAEKIPALSYFLGFLPENVLRVSYATSFGTNELSDNMKQYAVPALKKFHAISVREENAVGILAAEGLPSSAVCDPTLLVEPKGYDAILQACEKPQKTELFNFMLRRGRESSDRTEAFMIDFFSGKTNLGEGDLEVEQWLWKLKHSDFVITDSFHCTVFAILFHKPFLAVNDKDCSMNARIKTLTRRLGLEHRVIDTYDPERIRQIMADTEFDWDAVDEKRKEWAAESAAFLESALTRK